MIWTSSAWGLVSSLLLMCLFIYLHEYGIMDVCRIFWVKIQHYIVNCFSDGSSFDPWELSVVSCVFLSYHTFCQNHAILGFGHFLTSWHCQDLLGSLFFSSLPPVLESVIFLRIPVSFPWRPV